MPLYTYNMTYRGLTKTISLRKSNPKGWIGQVVMEAYPGIDTQEPVLFGAIIRTELMRDSSCSTAWTLSCNAGATDFALHVVQTKD